MGSNARDMATHLAKLRELLSRIADVILVGVRQQYPTVCFTVGVCKGKVAFQLPNPVKQLVNESMYQNRVGSTSSDTVAVH